MPMPSGSFAPGIGSTPEPIRQTPTPSSDEFPRSNRGATPVPTSTPLASPSPGASATAEPPAPGLARLSADEIYGKNTPTGGFTAYGHVQLDYADAHLTADQAVYDATTKILRATGHVHYTQSNGDSAVASALEYHSDSDRVELFDVSGQTAALNYQGEQIQGALSYRGREAIIDSNGHTIIRDGWITTCDLRHVAYHITGKEIEVRPHDRVIAHNSALFLGKVLVAALGIVVIPLTEIQQRQAAFAPRIGYNSSEGFFIRSFINFYRGPNWYGTYHIDYFQKVGLGLGLDAFFQRQDQRGGGSFSFYNLRNNGVQEALSGQKNSLTANLNLSRAFNDHLNGSLQFSYSGQSAVFTALPATTSANLAINHIGARSNTSYNFTNSSTGPSSSFGAIVNHTIAFSPTFSQSIGLNLSSNSNPGAFSRAIGFDATTHVSAQSFDADLVTSTNHGFQTSNIGGFGGESTAPVIGIQRVPELTIRARPFQIPTLRLPVSVNMIDGNYNDGYDNIATTRYELSAQIGPGIYRLGDLALFNASATVRQDAYGTGDLQGSISEQVTMENYIGRHADNTLFYTEQSVRGFTPMLSFDKLSGSDQIGEVLNIYNGSLYRFTASTSYDFHNKFLSTINYQLNVAPNPYAFASLGTSYDPHGSGYSPLVISLATPLTRNDSLQFTGNYDFKLHGLQGQNYFLSHTVNDCYVVRLAYRQPLKEVDVSLSLLAFPSQSTTFGINNNGPILAQPLGGGF